MIPHTIRARELFAAGWRRCGRTALRKGWNTLCVPPTVASLVYKLELDAMPEHAPTWPLSENGPIEDMRRLYEHIQSARYVF